MDGATQRIDIAAPLEAETDAPERRARRRKRDAWGRQGARLTWTLLILPLISMVVMFIAPIGMLLWMSFESGDGGVTLEGYEGLLQPVYLRLLGFTLELALYVTIACAVLAYPIAYLMVNIRSNFTRWMAATLFISLWLSFLARTFSWIIILQRNGLVNDILLGVGLIETPLELVYNQTGVYIGLVHILLPLMIIAIAPSLKGMDPAYVRAALSLGARPFKAFWQVYFPLSLPGVVAGSMLVFTLAFGFFITPAILGGGQTPTIVLAIRDQIQEIGDLRLAAATSMVLLVICLAILLIYDRISGVDRIYETGRT